MQRDLSKIAREELAARGGRKLPESADIQELINTKLLNAEQEAEILYEAYPEQMDYLESRSLLSKCRPIAKYDIWAVGKQLEALERTPRRLLDLFEEEGNANSLGLVPRIAFDVVTVAYGASIIPIIASVQPIQEENGTVYFRNIRFGDTRGSQTAGGTFVNPKGVPQVTPRSYASNGITGESEVASTSAGVLVYNFTLTLLPVRSGTITINSNLTAIAGQTPFAQDSPNSDGQTGTLLGLGMYGTVNYITGAVSLTLGSDPGNGKAITANYQQNMETAGEVPLITQFMDSQNIRAKVYTLRATFGILQAFAMRQRFGLVAEDELANDLVAAINTEIGGELVLKIRAAATSQTAAHKFDTTLPSGVGRFEHFMSYKTYLNQAEGDLVASAGRGTVSVIVADRAQCAVIASLDGFQKLTDGNTLGAHIFGTLDGVVVVRVNDTNILAQGQGILLWKGPSPFEAPAVYTPFMPLMVTPTLQNLTNPLLSTRAAAVWAGLDVLVGNFAMQFDVANS